MLRCWALGLACSLCGLLHASALAAAEPTASDSESKKQACVDAHLRSQQLRREGRLVKARSELGVCATVCPAIVQSECVEWAAQVERSIASIQLKAETDQGEVLDVSVSMDGAPLVEQLDFHAIEIDPGVHVFVFRHKDRPPLERHVVVREGERNKLISVRWAAPLSAQQAAPVARLRPIPITAFVASGVAVLGFVTFASFGLWGVAERDSLVEDCAPFCSQEDKRGVRNKLIVADVGLGVGIAGLATSAVLYLTRPEMPPPVQPTISERGAAFSVTGKF